MKTGLGFRHWVLGCITGFSVFVGLCFLAGVKPIEMVIERFMLPGALVSSALGLGRDDLQGVLLYLGGNAAFYALIFVAIFRMTMGPAPPRNSSRNGSSDLGDAGSSTD
jgi:hypothetical protein